MFIGEIEKFIGEKFHSFFNTGKTKILANIIRY